ncbi:hypothetical protein BAE44_0006444 [Dichanthelium oligosanthes]|uniref:Uncharacterized protein n=1 Tax=Dichanthelium oligosanthes TaxID=888268 RepID=A0A1E5W596_9POAL|nr:hypothetical protein BAE44_0006444 [Dichanthelium oligosanthes]
MRSFVREGHAVGSVADMLPSIRLDESCGEMKWVLKYDRNLGPVLACSSHLKRSDGPWVLQDINYYEEFGENTEEPVEHKLEWNSDSDDFLEERIGTNVDHDDDIWFIGFHPYKEVVFFSRSLECKGLAYHLSSSKVQNLGNLRPKFFHASCFAVDDTTFSYTPCWMEELPGSN